MLKEFLSRTVLSPIARRAGRSYIAGPELQDAIRVARRLAVKGFASTLCFWDTPETAPNEVAAAYLGLIRAIDAECLDGYVSIKAPSLRYDPRLCLRLAQQSAGAGASLHFDSLGPETADATLALIERLLADCSNVSFTLPGRWPRSLGDADWAIARRLGVRVVKGQWSDPTGPDIDPHTGFLRVIGRLAGRANRVAVATHDPKLAQAALHALLGAGTPCELELLFGLPVDSAIRVARSVGVRVRLYVPYGYGWLPYSMSQACRHPHILWWILRDVFANGSQAGIYAAEGGH